MQQPNFSFHTYLDDDPQVIRNEKIQLEVETRNTEVLTAELLNVTDKNWTICSKGVEQCKGEH